MVHRPVDRAISKLRNGSKLLYRLVAPVVRQFESFRRLFPSEWNQICHPHYPELVRIRLRERRIRQSPVARTYNDGCYHGRGRSGRAGEREME